MDIPTLLIRITGVVLFGWTVKSVIKHYKDVKVKENKESQAVSEQVLNNTLFYVWLIFMFAFSIGMVVNN